MTPNREPVQKMLIFGFLTTYDGSVIRKLKPVDWIYELEGETKLTIFFSFYVLYKGVKTHIE